MTFKQGRQASGSEGGGMARILGREVSLVISYLLGIEVGGGDMALLEYLFFTNESYHFWVLAVFSPPTSDYY